MSAGLDANARRFSGFADLYDRVRPSPPGALADLVLAYAGTARASLLVDLGSGTGLSTRWAATWADAVVGVEPSDDMRARAVAQSSAARESGAPDNVSFRAGWAHDTGLADGCAEVVTAVQALHWMDPEPTFAEVARILRPGGVFVALDCDWPPKVGSRRAEEAWDRCRAIVKVFEDRAAGGAAGDDLRQPIGEATDLALPVHFGRDAQKDRTMPAGVRAWSKDEHLARMAASGAFGWCTELAAHSLERGDHARFVDLFRSQGHLQQLLAAGLDEDTLGVTAFVAAVSESLGDSSRPFLFTYRVRLAVK
jgi:SAM-dependent methyltransferase